MTISADPGRSRLILAKSEEQVYFIRHNAQDLADEHILQTVLQYARRTPVSAKMIMLELADQTN